jgi:hypothetical protein
MTNQNNLIGINLLLQQDTMALISDQSAKLGISYEEFVTLAVIKAAMSSDIDLEIYNKKFNIIKGKKLERDMKAVGEIPFSDDSTSY